MAAFDNLLMELRESSADYRTMGDKFERLMIEYFKTDPLYKDNFTNIWMWRDFLYNEGKIDTGVDLVAETTDNKYVAIQCKFYEENHTLQKKDIDSFLNMVGKNVFSEGIIVTTTDKWSKHAEDAIADRTKNVHRLRFQDLAKSAIDWEQFSLNKPAEMKLAKKKKLRPHQQEALDKVKAGFETEERGKLVMACGTGKTFTSLKIAEGFAVNNNGHTLVLYLVPSISLLSQTLREWNNDTEIPFNTFAVCSDTKVTKQSEDITAVDLGYPATTDSQQLVKQFDNRNIEKKMSVVFSTYQSIEVISKAQEQGLIEFDLIISDEAHRTTGVTLAGEDESHFTRVHNNSFIKAKKRLYQTATPKIFSDETQKKATDVNAILCSMDDEDIFGKEFHYLGFGDAVSLGLLTDYKVMVLAVSEDYVHKAFVNELKDNDNALQLSDVVKITGCWNGLSKRKSHSSEKFGPPMKRAVAFSKSIKDSKLITDMFGHIVDEHIRLNNEDDGLECEVEHVDGTFNALERNKKIDWLKSETQENVCRILSNARCLTEGVDVPDLDAVMFLNPRNSVVDVVQAVGRVMRKAEGKDYGYIILPIGIPSDMSTEQALNDNQKYKVVWQVLQALRAHDERFNTMVNQIELNKKKPDKINVIGVGGSDGNGEGSGGNGSDQITFNFPNLEDLRDAVYGKLVEKVGDRRYWESWSKDVAEIAQRHYDRISFILENENSEQAKAFFTFLKELQFNLNSSINTNQAIEMLSQHLITKPVFEALFEDYSFVKNNPVSKAMEEILLKLDDENLNKETQSLDKFYESVKLRASKIDNLEGKQKIIIELYDKFFRSSFTKTTKRLGIVYTPIEIVDFILKSVNEILYDEFKLNLNDKNVAILDPFTGTGTFIVRLLQSGLINKENILYKYTNEIHANEIILLAYYIATVNIEETLHSIIDSNEYIPFNGSVLADTFQMTEETNTLSSELFGENSLRAKNQNERKIVAIVGNPPYSAKQQDENDNNKNIQYKNLDANIKNTYIYKSNAQTTHSIYDPYIRAIRWSTDRIDKDGIIGFVTNGTFLDSTSADGLRASLVEEFNSIYVFNLRGNQRTKGEESRKEGGKIFGSGSRTPVAITILVKNSNKTGCEIFYYDVGSYLSREQKLDIIVEKENFINMKNEMNRIHPDKNNDWINQQSEKYEEFVPLNDGSQKIFYDRIVGISSSRDSWVINYSIKELLINVKNLIVNYNNEVSRYINEYTSDTSLDNFIILDSTKIGWSRNLKKQLQQGKLLTFNEELIETIYYRPFTKRRIYNERRLIENPSKWEKVLPNNKSNLMIITTGESTLISRDLIDKNCLDGTNKVYPLYIFDEETENDLFSKGSNNHENVTEYIKNAIKENFRKNVSASDVFYYIYGILNSNEFKEKYANDFRKNSPRVPLSQNYEAFVKAGKMLAELHLNYEAVKPYKVVEEVMGEASEEDLYKVQKMRFVKKEDKSRIKYNNFITISSIPLEAYDFVINGRSAIEWIIDQYQIKIDEKSKIINDPNLYSENPRYILDLLKRIITVSIETKCIIKSLPPIEEI
ncbi:MAG: DEAD/DEAH box helicase [Bacillota bacterium]